MLWRRDRCAYRMTDMDFRFQESNHTYWLGEKRLTGVTTVLGVLAKPQLIPWAARMVVEKLQEQPIFEELLVGQKPVLNARLITPEMLEEALTAHTKKKEAAGQAGTDSHALVETYIGHCIKEHKGEPYKDLNEPIQKFIDWAIENVDHFLFSERRMFNKDLFIAGTADFAYIGKDGKKYMADFKTSSGIYGIDFWLQVAAYRMLAEGEGDTPYDGATVVRMGKDGSFEVKQLFDYEPFKECFLACLKIYRTQEYIKGLTV